MAHRERMSGEELKVLEKNVRAYIEGRSVSPQIAMSMAIQFEKVLTELIAERARYDECLALFVKSEENASIQEARAERAESELQQAKARVGELERHLKGYEHYDACGISQFDCPDCRDHLAALEENHE